MPRRWSNSDSSLYADPRLAELSDHRICPCRGGTPQFSAAPIQFRTRCALFLPGLSGAQHAIARYGPLPEAVRRAKWSTGGTSQLPWCDGSPDQSGQWCPSRRKGFAMLTLLTAAAISVGSPVLGIGHQDFRLPVDIAARSEARCPGASGVTVCAKRADAQLHWRVAQDEAVPTQSSTLHVRSLRLQPARCANPVDDGLRCIKPVAFARINLDD